MRRRSALHILAGVPAMLLSRRMFAAAPTRAQNEFFIFIHAAGGWDVMLWADPRNERAGLVEPASTLNTDTGGLVHWRGVRLDGDVETFEILSPGDTSLRFGPAIGALFDLRDRLTIVNGLEMNTVSHPDGVAYSITGRHLEGGRVAQASCDIAVANELGRSQLIPAVAVRHPSFFVGDHLDHRVIPLQVNDAASIAASLSRNQLYLTDEDRAAVALLLSEEAKELASRSIYPRTYQQLAGEYEAQPHLLSDTLRNAFAARSLRTTYSKFSYQVLGRAPTLAAPFALEAMRRNLVRCVSFSLGSFDTHSDNYRRHARDLQDLFTLIATLVHYLDAIPHPTIESAKLAHHTHIFVFSDFCRSPQITSTGGRDHHPNNSALLISPKFRSGRSFGATDTEQLLPKDTGDGRVLTPPDLLATFLAAFGIEPRRYLRDGTVVRAMLS